jgi:hypothetical protein
MGWMSDDDKTEREPLIDRATEWLNDKLSPSLGTADLGPFGEPAGPPQAGRLCPICHIPMGQHRVEVDPADGRVYLHHPDLRIHEVLETGSGRPV